MTFWARLRACVAGGWFRATRTYNATHGAVTTLGITPEKASRLYDIPIELLSSPRPYREQDIDE